MPAVQDAFIVPHVKFIAPDTLIIITHHPVHPKDQKTPPYPPHPQNLFIISEIGNQIQIHPVCHVVVVHTTEYIYDFQANHASPPPDHPAQPCPSASIVPPDIVKSQLQCNIATNHCVVFPEKLRSAVHDIVIDE